MKEKSKEMEELTGLRQSKDALRLSGVFVDLFVVRDTGLEWLRLIGLHSVHVHQLRDRRDPRRGPPGHVGRLFQTELEQDLLLDGLQAERANLLVHPAGVAGVTGHRHVPNMGSLDAGGVEGTEKDQRK